MIDDSRSLESVDFSALAVGASQDGVDVAVIPGEKANRSIVDAAVRVVRATGAPVNWRWLPLSVEDCRKNGGQIPYKVLRDLASCSAILKGPLVSPAGPAGVAPSVDEQLRQALGLAVHMTELRSVPGLAGRPKWNLRVFRERHETLAAIEAREEQPPSGASKRVATRIAHAALEDAERLGRTRVTLVFDPNRPDWCDAAARAAVRQIVTARPQMHYEELQANSFIQDVVNAPGKFEVVLTSAGFGDFACRLGEAFVGGSTLVPAVSLGSDSALFEAPLDAPHSYQPIEQANPTALIMAAILLLEYVGQSTFAARLRVALDSVYAGGRYLTAGLGGPATTWDFAAAVIRALPDCGCDSGESPAQETLSSAATNVAG